MRLTEQMYTRSGEPPRFLRFAARASLGSGAIFAIFFFADWAAGRFELWPLQLLGSVVMGIFATILTPLEKAELHKLRVDSLNLGLLDLTDRMERLSQADLSTFETMAALPEDGLEATTAAGSAVDEMWRTLIAADLAARCDPGPLEAAAPQLRRYCLTPMGQLAIPLIVVPAVRRRLRGEARAFGRKPADEPTLD